MTVDEAAGGTVVMVEHDLDLIASADRTIELGPGGGDAGGQIIATGTPAELAATPASRTGPTLQGASREHRVSAAR